MRNEGVYGNEGLELGKRLGMGDGIKGLKIRDNLGYFLSMGRILGACERKRC